MNIAIHVTQEDIGAGQRGDCWHCPIAQAAERAFGFPVGVSGAILLIQEFETRILLPEFVRAWVQAFDGHKHVEPLTFYLPLARYPRLAQALQEKARASA